MTGDGFLTQLAIRARAVDDALQQYLPDPDTPPRVIHQSMRYSVFAGGKRLRPVLCLAANELAGGDPAKAMPAACAIELIHTYSLIHDDLPAMDNDDLRRGRPTNHKVFGEAMAILAGDALLTLGFGLLGMYKDVGPMCGMLVRDVAEACGTLGLIGGQVADLGAAMQRVSLQKLQDIHRAKTGALFRVAVRAGTMIAGSDEDVLAALTCFAEQFGLAFQITDDILDVVGSQNKMGKNVGSDARNHKTTYVSLLGLDDARRRARSAGEAALASLDRFGQEGDFLRQAALYVVEREF